MPSARLTLALARHAPHIAACGVAAGTVAGATRPGWTPAAAMAAALAAVVAAQTRAAVAAVGVAALIAVAAYVVASARMDATRVVPLRTGAQVSLEAEVVRVPSRSRRGWSYVARASNAVQGVPAGTRVWVSQPFGEPPAPGDLVRVTGRLGPATRPGDPAWWRRHLARLGVAARITDPAPMTTGHRGGWRGARDAVVAALRRGIERRAHGDDAAVVTGVVLGFDERLSDARRDAFRRAGTAHLLAVSGQNVALVGLAVLGAALAVGWGRGAALGCAAGAVVVYALLCPPGASVARATVTGLLVLAAQMAGRRRAVGYPVVLTFAGLVAWQPRMLSDPGFVLSFSAVVGILVLTGPITRRLQPWTGRPVAMALAVTAAATTATAPASLALFGQVSVVGLLVNLAAVPLAGVVLLCGLGGALAALAWPPAGDLPLSVAAGGAHVLVRLSDVAAGLPFATVGPRGALVTAALAAGVWAMARGVGSRGAARRVTSPRVRDLR